MPLYNMPPNWDALDETYGPVKAEEVPPVEPTTPQPTTGCFFSCYICAGQPSKLIQKQYRSVRTKGGKVAAEEHYVLSYCPTCYARWIAS